MHALITTLIGLIALDPSANLKNYVAKPDSSYKYEVRAKESQTGLEIVQLKMTSQVWQGIEWKHFVYIFKPEKITTPNHAMLFVTGGGWNESLDKPSKDGKIDNLPREAALLARQAGMPVVAITHVPFQPVFNGLVEDEIISMTFMKYLETKDPTWPLLFPMVKSAVRAMDACQEYLKKECDLEVSGFTVTGASKRGWTTWLTAASGDPRVKGIMPIVIDTLNMNAQMKHQLDSYGEYSEQIKDYTEKGIQQQMDTEHGRKLNAMVDPYSYRESLTLPKLIVNGTNDPYWTLDALNLYWDDLKGPKYIFYAPNGGHDLNPEGIVRLMTTGIIFAKMSAGQLTLPQLTWDIQESDSALEIMVKSDLAPVMTRAWIAHAETRDFRKSTWEHVPMPPKDDGFAHSLTRPGTGYSAMYGEAKYMIEGKPVYLCTNVRLVAAKKTNP